MMTMRIAGLVGPQSKACNVMGYLLEVSIIKIITSSNSPALQTADLVGVTKVHFNRITPMAMLLSLWLIFK
jgi:hypothetical protein